MNDTLNSTLDQDSPLLSIVALKPIAILFCAVIGIPLNGLIAFVIISMKRLHKPRNIFWLGVTFSNEFALLTSLVEFMALYVPSKVACTLYVLLVGIPYATILLNLLLALIDRFIAITYPLWHKDKVTIRRIFTAQLLGLLFISLLFKTSHLIDLDLLDVQCDEDEPRHGKIIVFTLLTLVLLCIIAQIVVYAKARKHFGEQRHGHPPGVVSSTTRRRPMENDETSFSSSTRQSSRRQSFFIHVGTETISRLEVEAAWTLVAGVSSLIVICSPIFIVLTSSLFCHHLFQNCSSVAWLIPYFRELVLVHTVYNPVVYIYRCREFTEALHIKLGSCCCPSHQSAQK